MNKPIKEMTPEEVADAHGKRFGGRSVYMGGGWIRHWARPVACEPVSFRVAECRRRLEARQETNTKS